MPAAGECNEAVIATAGLEKSIREAASPMRRWIQVPVGYGKNGMNLWKSCY